MKSSCSLEGCSVIQVSLVANGVNPQQQTALTSVAIKLCLVKSGDKGLEGLHCPVHLEVTYDTTRSDIQRYH